MSKTQYAYKNETDQDLTLVGVGVIAAGHTLVTDFVVENPNLTAVEVPKRAKKTVTKELEDVE